jgi:hypothetical protein
MERMEVKKGEFYISLTPPKKDTPCRVRVADGSIGVPAAPFCVTAVILQTS